MSAIALISYFLLAASITPSLAQQSELAKLKERYDRESDPIHRAKELAKYGKAQVEDAVQRAEDRDFSGALAELQTYHREVAETHKALRLADPNALHKPHGYKELQLSLRENLRHINDMIDAMPVMERGSFRGIQEALAGENRDLLADLFPPSKPPPKSRAEHP